MRTETVTIDQIEQSNFNVRTEGKDTGIEQLAASILAHGLLQPPLLRKTPEGQFEVLAGQRRMTALSSLIEAGKLPANFEITATVSEANDAMAVELSTVENTLRQDMSPYDQIIAFGRMVIEGSHTADIAARFGTTERVVKQRLRLSGLAPTILKALRDEQITIACAEAYALTEDTDRQEKWWNDNENAHWNRIGQHSVKRAMIDEAISSNSELAAFIGREVYEEAGGVVEEDLFGANSYWRSTDLVKTLIGNRVEAWRDEIIEAGWAFAVTDEELEDSIYSYRTLPATVEYDEETTAKLAALEERRDEIGEILNGEECDDEQHRALDTEWDSIEAQIEQIEEENTTYTDADKAKSGCVFMTETGRVAYAVVVPEKTSEGTADGIEGDDAPKPEKDPLAISAALSERLSVSRTVATRERLKEIHSLQALKIIAACLITKASNGAAPMQIRMDKPRDIERDYSAQPLDFVKVLKKLQKAGDVEAVIGQLMEALAPVIDLSDTFVTGYTSQCTTDAANLALETVGADLHEAFDAEDYFSSVGKPVLLEAIKDVHGKKVAETMKTAKKADLADYALRATEGTGWLPPQMRMKGYTKPKVVKPDLEDVKESA